MRLPDLRVEFEHALESGADLAEPRGVSRQRRAPRLLEVGLEIGTLQAEPEAMRLGERVVIRIRGCQDAVELARCLVMPPGRDQHACEMRARGRSAVRGGAFEERAGRGLVGF